MAHTWFELISSLLVAVVVLSVFGAVFFAAHTISAGLQNTKDNLRKQGINVSDSGLSIKTNKAYNHEDYVDATQRAFVQSMDPMAKASSFRRAEPVPGVGEPKRKRTGST